MVGEEEDGDEAVGMVRFFGFLEAAGAVKEAGEGEVLEGEDIFLSNTLLPKEESNLVRR